MVTDPEVNLFQLKVLGKPIAFAVQMSGAAGWPILRRAAEIGAFPPSQVMARSRFPASPCAERHARPFPVFVNEDDPCRFEGGRAAHGLGTPRTRALWIIPFFGMSGGNGYAE
jgi:hypothetical protein